MNGVKHLTVSFKGILYDLEFERNITVIRGNGGTGKTTLVDAIHLWLIKRARGIKIKSDCRVRTLDAGEDEKPDYIEKFRGTSDTLFFVDEGYPYLGCVDFAREFYKSGNYLVIIDRSGSFKGLDFAVNAIYVLETEKNGKQFITRFKHKYVNSDIPIKPATILTEDEGSGYELLKRAFDCNVLSAHGKDNIPDSIDKFKGENLYTVVDGAAFGANISKCVQKLSETSLLFAPESFEYLCLNCYPFYRDVKHYLDNVSDYIDVTKFRSWEQYFTHLLTEELRKYGETYKKSGDSLCAVLTSEHFLQDLRAQFKDIRG